MQDVAGTSKVPEDVKKESIRPFIFQTVDGSEMPVDVTEIWHPDYGMYTWPCAVVLAQYIWYNRDAFCGKQVLELAAGTGLPGLVAAKCGAMVTFTDSAEFPQCLENCRVSCTRNGLNDENVKFMSLTWGIFEQNMFDIKGLDYLLASDCFFDEKDFEDIVMTMSYIIEHNVGCKCLCTYQIRSANWTIEHLLDYWELQCRHIPVQCFGADDPNLAKSNLPGRHTIQMMEFTKKEAA